MDEYTVLICKYNKGIECAAQTECQGCGWNPEVEKERKASLRKKFSSDGLRLVLTKNCVRD